MYRIARSLAFLPALMLLLASGGCGNGDDPTTPEPPSPSIRGSWSGGEEPVFLGLSLWPMDGEKNGVVGHGVYRDGRNQYSLSAVGRHDHPRISLTFEVLWGDALRLQGEFQDDDTIVATVTGSGLGDQSLTLRRRSGSVVGSGN